MLFFENTLLSLNRILQQDVRFNHRTDDHGRKEFRERDPERDREREKERRQREKERLRRQDEERRRRRERQDGENSYRKREVEGKKEKERAMEQKKGDHAGDSSHSERPEKTAKDHKKEESAKRERLRNKVMSLSFQILKLLSEAFLRSFLRLTSFASGPARYSAVPARSQKPQSWWRREQLCRWEARH